MKALKSKLASEILADPAATMQLRRFLFNRHARQSGTGQIEVRRGKQTVKVDVTFVPKAS